MLFLMSMIAFGQQEVTKFLGIPVDGSKEEMVRKLKEKGFVEDPENEDILEGEFNGVKVNVVVVTNNGKVWRIMVCDAIMQSASDIRVRFNRLCEQFQNNEKYTRLLIMSPDYTIPKDEDIEYEMTINNKRYEAAYSQIPAHIDTIAMMKEIKPLLLQKYTEEELVNPTEEVQKDVLTNIYMYMFDLWEKRVVWFTITRFFYNKYYISMYYDNKYNEANGEDL